MTGVRGERVEVVADDGIVSTGLYYDAAGEVTVVHVHGKCGDFHSNGFIEGLARCYMAAGCNVLALNNRGSGCIVETYRHGEVVYVGGSLERFDEAAQDIDAAVSFAAARADGVVLQGHSHGCEKAYAYAASTSRVAAVVLLSPSNSWRLHCRYIAPEGPAAQLERLAAMPAGAKQGLAPDAEYGIATERRRYPIPIAYAALEAWLASPGIRLFDRSADRDGLALDVPVFAYVGGRDDLQLGESEGVLERIRETAGDCTAFTPAAGDHHLGGVVDDVAAEIVEWMRRSRLNPPV